jgi:di/tricarboxylate transporter
MEMTVPGNHSGVGRSLSDLRWEEKHQVAVIEIRRGDNVFTRYLPRRVLVGGDILGVQGEPEELLRFARSIGLEHPADSDELVDPNVRIFEVLLGPDAHVVGNSLYNSQFRERYEVQVLGIRQKNKLLRKGVQEQRLRVGDVLLLKGDAEAVRELAEEPGNIPLGEVDLDLQGRPPWWVPTLILAGVVTVAAVGWSPILVSALAGVVLMIYTRCLRMRELYENLQWPVVFMLAGLIPMGTAFDNSGTSGLLAQKAVAVLQNASPHMSIAIVYTVTFLMTSIVSNNATAVLLTPLALESATALGVPPERLLVTVMFGASAAFLTPMGYQTNTLVYGPGGYRFMDYVRVGLPLNLLMLVVVSFLVPLLWS